MRRRIMNVLLVGILALFFLSGIGCTTLKGLTSPKTPVVPAPVEVEADEIESVVIPVETKSLSVATIESEIPASGKIVKSIKTGDWDRELEIREYGDNYIIIAVPIFKDINDSWQVQAGIGWTDGLKWEVTSLESYDHQTTSEAGGWMTARINLPADGIGWYWCRIWGWSPSLQQWLVINAKSKYYRVASDGKPGYELLVHPASQKVQPVPEVYNTRE